MKKLKKLSRNDLKNVKGGQDCTLSIQQPDGTWRTYQGTCAYHAGNTNTGTGYPQGSYHCDIGDGQVHPITSNGGVSRCLSSSID